jgi:glutamate racemase
MTELLQEYMEPMIKANIDYLVLGCSHYPYLIPQIKKILPETVKIIDSGEAVQNKQKPYCNSTACLTQRLIKE